MKIPFPFSGTGMGVENSIPDFRDGNWRTVFPGIPGNSREFPGYCYCKFATSRLGIGILQIFGLVTHCLGKGGCLKWCQNTGIAKSSFPPLPPPSILAPFFTSTLPLPFNILHCTNAYNCNEFHRFF